MTQDSNDRGATSTAPEDLFTELFTQVFGPEKALFLSPQHPVTDIYGATRFVDLALRARGEKIAFEIDGLPWHMPEVVPVQKYEDDLFRQNSLVHQGWRVFRWTDRQVAHEPERVKEQLALFLERLPGLLSLGKCQYIPNSFVPVHPEQPRGYNKPKNDPRGGKSMSKQSVS